MHNYLHIYLQATIKDKKEKNNAANAGLFSKQKMLLLLNGLTGYVSKLHIKKTKTTWDDYYSDTILNSSFQKSFR